MDNLITVCNGICHKKLEASKEKVYLSIAVDLLKAAKAGNSSATAEHEREWYQNADELATFLSSANSKWSKDDLTKMLNVTILSMAIVFLCIFSLIS
jgi:hypothetical protein